MTPQRLLIIFMICIASVLLFFNQNRRLPNYNGGEEKFLDRLLQDLPSLSFPRNSPITNAVAIAEAWQTFRQYLEHARNHDLTGLKSLSHQTSESCKDPLKQDECFRIMDSVYAIGSKLNPMDFKHVMTDDKQTILFTDGPEITIIYFTRSEDGKLKILSIQFCLEDKEFKQKCIETDTEKRDLNKNGWWDQVEALFFVDKD